MLLNKSSLLIMDNTTNIIKKIKKCNNLILIPGNLITNVRDFIGNHNGNVNRDVYNKFQQKNRKCSFIKNCGKDEQLQNIRVKYTSQNISKNDAKINIR